MKGKAVFLLFLACGFCMFGQIIDMPDVTNQTVPIQQDKKKEDKTNAPKKVKDIIKESVEIKTEDSWILKGDLYKVNYNEEDKKLIGNTLLLLHMLPSDRSSYNQIIPSLIELGFNILNLDWRGHGESVYKEDKCPQGGFPTTLACPPKKAISYESFTNEDYKSALLDVEAAVKFLEEQGVKKENLGIIGASIGANYALQFAAKNPQIKFIVLLSPGLDYHGVKTIEGIKTLAETDVKILIYSSSTDEDTVSYKSCKKLEKEYAEVKGAKTTNLIASYKEYVGHGTDMLRHIQKDLINNIKQFIK